MTHADDRWTDTDMTAFDAQIERLLKGGSPQPDAPAWCSDVAVLVRAAHAPARPDELSREAEIVAAMRELRLTALAEPAIDADRHGDTQIDLRSCTGDRADETPARPREPGVLPPIVDLDDYRAKHCGERGYRAKHAAARLEASKYPLARTVGRVIAMKAAAVTTAAAIGVAAAAAATTGIVATVVVPALSESVRRPQPPATGTAADDIGESRGTSRSASEVGSAGDFPPHVACPEMIAACLPLPPEVVVNLPPDVVVPTATTPPGTASGTSTRPSSDDATTTTAAPETTTTTPPETTTTTPPETTTTAPPPTTTTTAPDPPPGPPGGTASAPP
jgi:hypothetical protein